jgi:hypothetical protein
MIGRSNQIFKEFGFFLPFRMEKSEMLLYYFTCLFCAHHGMPPGAYAREARMLGQGKN